MMESLSTDQIAQAIKNAFLAVASGFGCYWIMVNKTSDEWRLGAMALGFMALLWALATGISVLILAVEMMVSGVSSGLSLSSNLLRFHAFRKILAIAAGSAIAVGGFAAVSLYDPKWGIVPVLIGLLVMQLPGIWETLRNQPWFYRIFRSGGKPEAEFAQVYHLRKAAKPFRSCYRSRGGFCSNDLFLGTSTRETS